MSSRSTVPCLAAMLFLATPAPAEDMADSSIYELAEVSVRHVKPGAVLYTARWNGQWFADPELHVGPGSGLDFAIEAACPEAREIGRDKVVRDGKIRKLRLRLAKADGGDWLFQAGDGFTDYAASQGGAPVIGAAGPTGKHRWTGHLRPRAGAQVEFLAPAEEAVAACNHRLAELRGQGLGLTTAATRVGSVRPFSLRAQALLECSAVTLTRVNGEWQESSRTYQGDTSELPLDLQVACEADIDPPEPATTDLGQRFGITRLTFAPVQANQTTECPATVRYEGGITSNGPGTVYLQMVNEAGAVGPVRTVNFARAETQRIDHTFTVGGPRSGAAGGSRGLTLGRRSGASAATGLQLGAQTEPGQHQGWMKLVVAEGPQTNEAFWQVICREPPGPGRSDSLTAPGPGPVQPPSPPSTPGFGNETLEVDPGEPAGPKPPRTRTGPGPERPRR